MSLEIDVVRYLKVSTPPLPHLPTEMMGSLWNAASRIRRSLHLNDRAFI
jgi:hypothetical protein